MAGAIALVHSQVQEGGEAVNHNGNTNKMVSDTPRTDAEYERLYEIYRNAERFHGPLCCAFENDMSLCRQLERELNAANDRIKRLESLATDQRNRAEKWYIEEREGGDSVSIATTRAYFLAYTEIVREIRKAKEDKP